MRKICLILSILAIGPLAPAQSLPGPARLLADVGSATQPSMVESDFVRFGGMSYFVVRVDDSQRLYRTGGSAQTSEEFFDVDPNQQQIIRHLAAAGGLLFFFAGTDAERLTLWCTDGTLAGTRALTDATTLPLRVAWARGVGSQFVFLADASNGLGYEPWVSDGTVSGTQLLRDLTVGSAGTSGRIESVGLVPNAAGTGERVWFSGWEFVGPSQSQTSFWSLDGTPAGTRREALFGDFRVPGMPVPFGPGRVAYIVEGQGGAFSVVVLEEGQGAVEFASPSVSRRNEKGLGFDGRAVYGVVTGSELGFAASPSGVQSIALRGGTKNGPSVPIGVHRDQLLIAYRASGSTWRLAGLAAGQNVADDLGALPGEPSSQGSPFFRDAYFLGDRLMLVAQTPLGRSLFGVDYVQGAPIASQELYQGGGVRSVGELPGQVVFAAVRGPRHSLWASDGSMQGTAQIDELLGTVLEPDSNIREFTSFGERVAFLAGSTRFGRDPWITDGTSAGTAKLADLGLRRLLAEMQDLIVVGDEVWSVRLDPLIPISMLIEAWDGRVGGSREVARVSQVRSGGVFRDAVAFGDSLLFYGSFQTQLGVYRVDRDGSIHRVRSDGRQLDHIEVLGEQAIIFNRLFTGLAREAYLTDGTEQGTRFLGEVGNFWDEPVRTAQFRNQLWVSVDDGTFIVDETGVVPFPALPANSVLFAAGDRLFAYTESQLSVTDGTLAGTTQLLQGAPLAAPGRLQPALLGDRLLFIRGTGSNRRPWVTDGTAAGTVQLADIPLQATEFWVTGPNRCLFPGQDPVSGARSLCATGGTPSNTSVLEPLAIPNEPIELGIAHAGRVLVLVDDPNLGREPYVVDAGFGVDVRGRPCAGQGFGSPTLRVSDSPLLGRTVQLRAERAGASLGWFLLSAVRQRPLVIPGTRCSTEVDLPSAFVSPGQVLGPNGQFALTLGVPNVSALIGLRVAAQTVVASGAGPLGIDVSESIVLGLGR